MDNQPLEALVFAREKTAARLGIIKQAEATGSHAPVDLIEQHELRIEGIDRQIRRKTAMISLRAKTAAKRSFSS